MNIRALEEWVSETLGLPILLEVAQAGERSDEWSENEGRRCAELTTAARQREWLTGRTALNQVLRRLDLPPDTAEYAPPHSRLSLSHSLEKAVAAGTPCATTGLGVDLEYSPCIAERAQRFFLSEREIQHVNRQKPFRRDRERVRLWSIKEAVFKADLNNAGCSLNDFQLCVESGTAEKRDGSKFAFVSRRWENGFISVALKMEDK